MTDLEYELTRQVLCCCNINNFRSAVYVSTKDKVNIIVEKLKDITYGIWSSIEREVFGIHENYITFINGSVLRIITSSDQSRGRKFHGCVIDKDIAEDVKNIIIYPKIIPRMISGENYIFESWEDVKRRVVEVKIGEKDGRNH